MIIGYSKFFNEDIRQMERTLSVNYPVLRQNIKRVLFNTFEKHHGLKIQQYWKQEEIYRQNVQKGI